MAKSKRTIVAQRYVNMMNRSCWEEIKKARTELQALHPTAKITERRGNWRTGASNTMTISASVEKAVENAAECQVCERHQCTTQDGRLVHHGYTRPGWGMIVGDCFGASAAPFPAYDRLEAWEGAVSAQVIRLQAYSRRLARQTTIKSLPQNVWNDRTKKYVMTNVTYIEVIDTLRYEQRYYTAEMVVREADETWARLLKAEVARNTTALTLTIDELKRVRTRLALAKMTSPNK